MELEFLYNTEISIPVIQIVLLLVLSTGSLFFGKVKIALLVNYIFALYWGFFLNKEQIMSMVGESQTLMFMYFGLGVVVAILAVIGFLAHKS